MPLPWKKTKVGQISKFIADLHRSSKHGGSLFVETGFPTSLIDLFVKNRDRLRKRSNRKQSMSSPVSLSPPSMNRSVVREPEREQKVCIEVGEVNRQCKFNDPATKKVNSVNLDRRDSNEQLRGEGNQKLFIAAVEILALVVLAMSTKKLTVAVTFFAFMLLLVEYTAARVCRFSKPFPSLWIRYDFFVSKLYDFVKTDSEKVIFDEKLEISTDSSEIYELEVCGDEIRAIESNCKSINCDGVGDNTEKSELEGVSRFKIIDYLVKENEGSNCRSNLTSKIARKLIPKKFRKSEKAG